jgi:hypothetical protein
MVILENFWMFGLMSTKKRRDKVWGHSSVLFVIYTCWYDDVSTEVGFWSGGLPSEACLALSLDLRWRQINVALWSTCFGCVVWIASTKFSISHTSHMIRNMKLFALLWSIWFYILWYYYNFISCDITVKLWSIWSGYMATFAFALFSLICIRRNHSQIGGKYWYNNARWWARWLQQHMLMSNVVVALTPSPWDVWVPVKSCIASLHSYLHCIATSTFALWSIFIFPW